MSLNRTQRCGTPIYDFADLPIGDGVTDANVHGEKAGRLNYAPS
jgi:hypothetical protein